VVKSQALIIANLINLKEMEQLLDEEDPIEAQTYVEGRTKSKSMFSKIFSKRQP